MTNHHELDNVRDLRPQIQSGGDPDRSLRVRSPGQALTCNPETLTIRACADASCSQLFTDPVSAIPTPQEWQQRLDSRQPGELNGNTAAVTFSNGTAKLQLRKQSGERHEGGVSGHFPPPSRLARRFAGRAVAP